LKFSESNDKRVGL